MRKNVQLGADIYLEKPMDFDYLRLILLRLAKRMDIEKPEFHTESKTKLVQVENNKSWRLDHQRWVLIAPNQISVSLTPSEYGFLSVLIQHSNQLTTHLSLAKQLGRERCFGYEKALNTLLSRLKTKIKNETGCELEVKSSRGKGYVLMTRIHD